MPETDVPPVLLVEDDEGYALLIRTALRRAGISRPVVHLPDGALAVRYLAAEPPYDDRSAHLFPALVLLDLEMQGVSGLEVLEWRREREAPLLIRLPIVVLTGSDDPGKLRRARRLGAADVLAKPSDPVELPRLLRRTCRAWLVGPEGEGTSEADEESA